jgi:molybdate transport system substrate-binding protein
MKQGRALPAVAGTPSRPRRRPHLRRSLALLAAALSALLLLVALAGCSSGASSAAGSGSPPASGKLLLFAGSASQPPTEEAIKLFKQKTGIDVEVVFGGSGTVLSQMELTKKGDLYFPGSSDYMEKAKSAGDVLPETEARLAYLVPAINVQKGNPKHIESLADLTRPGVRVAIADPESVCVGLYAAEIIDKQFTPAQKAALKANLVNYTASCDKTAAAVSLKQVDAVIGWSVFEHWDPARIQTVKLPASQISRVGYLPIAVAKYAKDRSAAQQFVDFLAGPEGQAVFAKYRYFATPEEAFAYVGVTKPVGGELALPADWLTQ